MPPTLSQAKSMNRGPDHRSAWASALAGVGRGCAAAGPPSRAPSLLRDRKGWLETLTGEAAPFAAARHPDRLLRAHGRRQRLRRGDLLLRLARADRSPEQKRELIEDPLIMGALEEPLRLRVFAAVLVVGHLKTLPVPADPVER